jgi:hypothetical protein
VERRQFSTTSLPANAATLDICFCDPLMTMAHVAPENGSLPSRSPTLRFNSRQMLGCVAILAVVMAAVPPRSGPGVLFFLFACLLVAAASGCRPSRCAPTAASISSFYPIALLLSLYGTWLTAWHNLGHRPRIYFDDPKLISISVNIAHSATWILLGQFFPAAKVSLFVILIAVCRLFAGRSRPTLVSVFLLLLPFLAWASCVLLIRCDPGDVFYWFRD